jgi:glycosyltransferase involved in cell wall biosynthesis
MISIILPAYNEEVHIRNNIEILVSEMKRLRQAFEIIIIEESRDKTPEICKKLATKYKNIKHIHFDHRLGKGLAIENGVKYASGDKLIFMDVDLATDLGSMNTMIQSLEDYDIVIGSRYHPMSNTNRTPFRIFLGFSYALILRVLFMQGIRDYQCGFKGFKKSVGNKIIRYTKERGLFWDTEFLFIAGKLGFSIKEIPVSWIEKKGRSAKISIKLIIKFILSLTKLFFSSKINRIDFSAN